MYLSEHLTVTICTPLQLPRLNLHGRRYPVINIPNTSTAIAEVPATDPHAAISFLLFAFVCKKEASPVTTTKTSFIIKTTFQAQEVAVAVMPVGEPIKITLVSNDVVHGFYVPAFNFSRYAQPGYTNYFDLNIVKAGYYPGRCTQYCGVYHTEMLFGIKAVSPGDFVNWINTHPASLKSLVHTG